MAQVILITGANRGAGFSILRGLAQRSLLHHYLLGTRRAEKGLKAIEKLHKLGIKAQVDTIELDVTSDGDVGKAE
ncbi:hypothetical protein MMC06_003749 [Schaereria dolodes]|nr:hypothetical protein [Schaereria dolodes]